MLVEREESLARLRALLDEAEAGSGRLVLLAGEAGIGKTSLVSAFAASAGPRWRVRRGACDDIGPASALGALLDAFPELVETAAAVDRPVLYRRLRALLAEAPTLVVLEDLHWADEATLDVLRFLGRRLADLPVLVAATYRDDEAPPGTPLAVLLGDLATAPGVSRLALRPLSPAAVRLLAERAGSTLDPAQLHRSTEGNPFFVTEVLATQAMQLPGTVRDAVLARTARLSGPARQVLAAAAVLGPRAELPLLVAVSGSPAEAVDECIGAGMLVADGEAWSFRHDLASRAVEQSLPPGARAALHAVALRVLGEADERDDARLAHHAAASGDRDAVRRHAPAAADRAARLGAHREAADLHRLALRFCGRSAPDRRRWLEALGNECFLTLQLEDARAAHQEAMELAREAGDTGAVGQRLLWLSRISWLLGERPDAVDLVRRAVTTLERAGPAHRHDLAMAYAQLGTVSMQGADTAAALEWGQRALELARKLGDVEPEIHALNTIGATLVNSNRPDEGIPLVERSLELALREDAHFHAARAYQNLSAMAFRCYRYDLLDRTVREGVPYCAERDLDTWAMHLIVGRGRGALDRGRFAEVDEVVAYLRSRSDLPTMTRLAVEHCEGMLAVLRTGDDGGHLDEGWQIAERYGEEQFVGVVAAARTQAAWIRGRLDDIVPEVDRGWSAALAQGNAWQVGEFAWWLKVAGDRRDIPEPVARPFRLMLDGAWREAAAAWEDVGCPMWQAYALASSPDLADARRAVAIAEEVGALAVRDAILRHRREAGLPVPVGPRSATRANPLRLTRRELEVLELLVEGLTNPEMARRLYLSERTVAHHVSSVLQKLGEPNRSRAVVAAVRQGIVASPS